MSSRSKAKGYTFEVEIVRELIDAGIPAVRAWGSNGASIGQGPKVDVLAMDSYTIQAKRRRALPEWLSLEGVHAVVIREDHGEKFALIRFDDLKKILRRLVDEKTSGQ